MKSLGKQKVHRSHYNDGILRKEWIENKTVYEKNDGTFWVNYMCSKYPADRIYDHETQSYRFIYKTQSYAIQALSVDSVINRIVNKVKDAA